jgi:CheY-like chemotaxis protein
MMTVEFNALGCDVRSASSAEEGEALLKAAPPAVDVIILDFVLPGISGPQLMRRLHRDSNTADIPIVPFTSLIERHDKAAGDVLDEFRVNKSAQPNEGAHPMVSKGTKGEIYAVPGSLVLSVGHALIKHKVSLPPDFRARMRLAGEQLG